MFLFKFDFIIGFLFLLLLLGCERSVVGLNFDFVVLNLTKHSSYLIYNACLYFSSAIQNQYYEKYGYEQVRAFFFLIVLCSQQRIWFSFDFHAKF